MNPLDDMLKHIEERGISFVFWVCPDGCNGRVTWNEDKTDATCEVCGRKKSDGLVK